jgi:hypothetical protein
VSRVVCRKCWTWHGSGATVCPRCGAPVGSGNEAEPGDVENPSPTPVVAQPIGGGSTPTAAKRVVSRSRSGVASRRRLGAIAVVALVLAAVGLVLILQRSARVASADGTFSVQPPSGWARYTGADLPDGPPTKNDLLVLVGPTADGVPAHLFIYHRQAGFIELAQLDRMWTADLDQATCRFAGSVGHFSRMAPTTIAGSAALVTECRTPTISVEVITVNHGNHTDMLAFSAASSQFDHLRDRSLQGMLDSWHWN